MSYEFGLCFKQVENELEAYQFAKEVTRIALKNAKKLIQQNLWQRPGSPENKLNVADFYWLYSLFNFRFVYWKEHNVLGLFDTGYPDEIVNCFDTNQIFQNATDQNYELSSWDDKIKLFVKIKTECLGLNEDEFMKEWKIHGFDIDEDCHLPEDYRLCCLVYQKIYKALHLDAWEEDCDDESFEKFAMSPLTSGQKISNVKTLFRIAFKEYLEEESEL